MRIIERQHRAVHAEGHIGAIETQPRPALQRIHQPIKRHRLQQLANRRRTTHHKTLQLRRAAQRRIHRIARPAAIEVQPPALNRTDPIQGPQHRPAILGGQPQGPPLRPGCHHQLKGAAGGIGAAAQKSLPQHRTLIHHRPALHAQQFPALAQRHPIKPRLQHHAWRAAGLGRRLRPATPLGEDRPQIQKRPAQRGLPGRARLGRRANIALEAAAAKLALGNLKALNPAPSDHGAAPQGQIKHVQPAIIQAHHGVALQPDHHLGAARAALRLAPARRRQGQRGGCEVTAQGDNALAIAPPLGPGIDGDGAAQHIAQIKAQLRQLPG